MQSKVNAYFKAGVRLVFVIYLKIPSVHVYDGPTTVRILSPGEELDCGAVIPGFRIPLDALFRGESGPT